jgi:sensor domain CHASE-containing protein
MNKHNQLIIWIFAMVLVTSSCSFTQEDLQNKAKEVLLEQANKIDSTLVKKIDHQVKDVDSLINQTTVKSIRDQIDQKIKDADTLINGIKKSVETIKPLQK